MTFSSLNTDPDKVRDWQRRGAERYAAKQRKEGRRPLERRSELAPMSQRKLDEHRAAWEAAGIDYGLCLCGCGLETSIAPQSKTAIGHIKGEPVRYVRFHNRRGTTTPCAVCGSEFERRASETERRFCSRECWRRFPMRTETRQRLSRDRQGARNPAYRHGRRVGVAEIYKAFNLRLKGATCCRTCGRTEPLNLHHALPRSLYRAGRTELLNGIPLCIRCHNGWHRKTTTIFRDVFTAEEWAYLSSAELTGQRVEAWLDDHYPDRGRPFTVLSRLERDYPAGGAG